MDNQCGVVNEDGTLETKDDTIRRLVKNRDELVQELMVQELKKLQQENKQYKEALDKAHVLLEKYESMLE